MTLSLHNAMKQITIDELPESVQQILVEVAESNNPVTITRAGSPLVILRAAKSSHVRAPFGAMEGTGEILGDILSPLDEPWEVLQ
jgi:hypothetical protein